MDLFIYIYIQFSTLEEVYNLTFSNVFSVNKKIQQSSHSASLELGLTRIVVAAVYTDAKKLWSNDSLTPPSSGPCDCGSSRRLGRFKRNIFLCTDEISTYDHRVWRTGLPVRSAVLKPHAGRLVVWWVTTCESLLLYVLFLRYLLFFFASVYATPTSIPRFTS